MVVLPVTTDELLDLFCEGLEIEPGQLTLDTKIRDIPEWTSIGWLAIMALVDERLGVQIEPKNIREFKTVKDLVQYIKSRKSVSDQR